MPTYDLTRPSIYQCILYVFPQLMQYAYVIHTSSKGDTKRLQGMFDKLCDLVITNYSQECSYSVSVMCF